MSATSTELNILYVPPGEMGCRIFCFDIRETLPKPESPGLDRGMNGGKQPSGLVEKGECLLLPGFKEVGCVQQKLGERE